jgi:sigma-B regulation protein RsbU (phosphoserine phosphatase)
MAQASRQSGISLSVKLILTTALLLAVAIGAAAVFSLRTIQGLGAREAEQRRQAGEAAIRRQSELTARKSATSAAPALADNATTYLDALVEQTVAEDPNIEWIVIADALSRRVVSRSRSAPPMTSLDDALHDKVMAAAEDTVVTERDAADPTRYVVGVKIALGGRVIGEVRLGVSTGDLERALEASIADTRARARSSAMTLGLIAAGILVFGVILGALQGLQITRPLRALSHGAKRIAEGDLAFRVDVKSRDEIGGLARNFNHMADRLAAMLADAAARAGLEREMELARTVQVSMIPPSRLIEHGPFRVVGHYEPATACGGDWWTVHLLSGDRLLIAVGDVTGHGVAAALVAATARGAVEALAAVDEKLLNPPQVLRSIDSAIRGVGGEQLLMTCFVASIDANRGLIDYSNAAHNFPYITHVDGNRTVRELSVLAMRGSPLGHEGAIEVQSGQRKLSPGDTLVFYTDGVIDRIGARGERFGDRRLRQLLLGRTFGAGGAGITALRSDIVSQLAEFAGGAPADDDVTLVLCQFDPDSAAGTVRRRAFA